MAASERLQLARGVKLLFGVVLLIRAHSVHAVPSYWISRYDEPQQDCLAHPEIGYQAHAAPTINSNIVFSFNDSSGRPVTTTVCPGATYFAKVTLPAVGHALYTLSQGRLTHPFPEANDFGQPEDTYLCPNRYWDFHKAPTAGWSDTLTVPCGASGSVVLKVTTAAGRESPYLTNSATLTVDPSCAAAACEDSDRSAYCQSQPCGGTESSQQLI